VQKFDQFMYITRTDKKGLEEEVAGFEVEERREVPSLEEDHQRMDTSKGQEDPPPLLEEPRLSLEIKIVPALD
jgi:hypothetical protein